MTRTALLCSASALMFCATSATLAAERAKPATHFSGTVHRIIAAIPGAVTLYDQNSDDKGKAILSTDFDDYDSWDSYGADDFTIPTGHKWRIREIEVSGSYSCRDCGGAASESVFFYRDRKSQPGKLIAKCEAVEGTDSQGSFAIKIPKQCKIILKGGKRYWISVSAAMEFHPDGYWGWETRNDQKEGPAMWENPGGGLNNCRSWGVMTDCIGDYSEGPDFMFALKGDDIVK